MTKQDVDIILALVKEYVKNLLSGWGLSDTDKSLIAFEQKYMPYTEYSGKQSVDHVLFRRFLRIFDPEDVVDKTIIHLENNSDSFLASYQKKRDESLKTKDKTIVGAINELRNTGDVVQIAIEGAYGTNVLRLYSADENGTPDAPDTPTEYYNVSGSTLECISADYVQDGVLYITGDTEFEGGCLTLIGAQANNPDIPVTGEYEVENGKLMCTDSDYVVNSVLHLSAGNVVNGCLTL